MVKIKIKKLDSDAKIPNYSHEGDAGLDLYSIENCILKPGERRGVHTGISIALPKGYVSLVWDKSGIARKGITTIAGVLDSNYRGEYIIMLFNIGTEDYEIKKGQKITQILIQPVVEAEIEEVEELDETSRGAEGFGSTGLI